MIKVKLQMLPMPSVKRPNLSRTSFWIEESLNVLYVKDMGEEGFSLKRQTTWCKIYWRKAWRKYALCVNPLLVKMQIHGKRTIDITSYSWSFYGYQIATILRFRSEILLFLNQWKDDNNHWNPERGQLHKRCSNGSPFQSKSKV